MVIEVHPLKLLAMTSLCYVLSDQSAAATRTVWHMFCASCPDQKHCSPDQKHCDSPDPTSLATLSADNAGCAVASQL